MINDADLPPLPQLFPVADTAFTMRCMTDDALRSLQREAFEAGMRKAAMRPTASGVRRCVCPDPAPGCGEGGNGLACGINRPTASGAGDL